MNGYKKLGQQTIIFTNTPTIASTGTVVGPIEDKGPLGGNFDIVLPDNLAGEMSWEKTEQKMMQKSVEIALEKLKLLPSDLDYFLGGDLLNQIISANFTARYLGVSFLGLFGACSTFVQGLALGGILVDGGYGNRVGVAASSHHETAERQFRFPTELGVQRGPTAQWTVMGSGATIISCQETQGPKLTHATLGKVIDYGVANPSDMGSAMAPAAADTIVNHLKDTNRSPEDYDLIVTGDLGIVGKTLTQELVAKQGYDISKVYSDCGVLIYDPSQDTHAGGSGCGCSAVVFSGHLIQMLLAKKFRRILLVGTGALLSSTSQQQGESIPGIGHGVVIENMI